MKFAVVEINDKQHLLEEGYVLTIDGNHDESKIIFDKLMLVLDDNQPVIIGQPFIKGATVEAEVLESGKQEKDIVFKFKRKTGYKVTKGHRQNSTTIKIIKISAPGLKLEKAAQNEPLGNHLDETVEPKNSQKASKSKTSNNNQVKKVSQSEKKETKPTDKQKKSIEHVTEGENHGS